MLTEYLSHFYRSLIPTPLWFGYFSNYYDTGAIFAIIVTAVYLMIKGAVIISKGKDLIRAVLTFIRDKVRGWVSCLLFDGIDNRVNERDWKPTIFT